MYLFEASRKTNLSVFHHVMYIHYFVTLKGSLLIPSPPQPARATRFRKWRKKEKKSVIYCLICLITLGIWKSILVGEIDKMAIIIWREEMTGRKAEKYFRAD